MLRSVQGSPCRGPGSVPNLCPSPTQPEGAVPAGPCRSPLTSSHGPTGGARDLLAGGLGVVPQPQPIPHLKWCRGAVPAGGLGVLGVVPTLFYLTAQGAVLPAAWGVSPNSLPTTQSQGAAGAAAGGFGGVPNPSCPPKAGVQGSPCRGFGGVPQSILQTKQGYRDLLAGGWGVSHVPPNQSQGCRAHPAGGRVSPNSLSHHPKPGGAGAQPLPGGRGCPPILSLSSIPPGVRGIAPNNIPPWTTGRPL